jgi:hypothetical protein
MPPKCIVKTNKAALDRNKVPLHPLVGVRNDIPADWGEELF